jgi:imidazole glycerol-phosphate synthase subunit HisH
MTNVVVVDYGMGNIKSVQRGLQKVGANVKLSSIPEEITVADCLVLPGVGAFEDGMKGLNDSGVIPAINEFVKSGKSLLGICLGMQMLMESSEEFGFHKGLGYIPGIVQAIPPENNKTNLRKIPHIGWSALRYPQSRLDWNNTILKKTLEGDFFYFVHSFMAITQTEVNLLAQCEYEGMGITAAIQNENITGLQFHPEKSGESGLKILKSFIND